MSKFQKPDFADIGPVVSDSDSELFKMTGIVTEGVFAMFPQMTFEAAVETHCAMLTAKERAGLHKELKHFLEAHDTDTALRDAWPGGVWPENEDHRAILQSACDRLCD